MKEFLSHNWETGTMISELISSMFLVIFVSLTTFFFSRRSNELKTHKYVYAPILYGLSGMVSIYIGMACGNAINDGSGLALMSMPFTFVKAIYWNTWNLVPAALAFQVIGSFVGVLIYIFISKTILKVWKNENAKVEDGIIIPSGDSWEFGLKEAFAQILVILGFVFLTSADYGLSIMGNVYMGIFISSIWIGILFALFGKYYYYLLSPDLILAHLVAGHFYGITKLSNWKTFTIQWLIQLVAIALIAYPEYVLRTDNG